MFRIKESKILMPIGEMSCRQFYVSVLSLTVIASTLLVGADGACNETKYRKCTEFGPPELHFSFNFTETGLEAQCRYIYEYVSCLEDADCYDEWANVTKPSTDYICKEHKEELVKNAPCFRSKNVETSLNFCFNLSFRNPGDRSCEAQNRMTSCTVKSLSACCGQRAGDLFHGYVRVVQNADRNSCQGSSDVDMEIHPVCSGSDRSAQYSETTLLAIVIVSLLGNDLFERIPLRYL